VFFEGQTLLDGGMPEAGSGSGNLYYKQIERALARIAQFPPTLIFPERFRRKITWIFYIVGSFL
jgi:hypothetical protein